MREKMNINIFILIGLGFIGFVIYMWMRGE